jgi:hypothetical protein
MLRWVVDVLWKEKKLPWQHESWVFSVMGGLKKWVSTALRLLSRSGWSAAFCSQLFFRLRVEHIIITKEKERQRGRVDSRLSGLSDCSAGKRHGTTRTTIENKTPYRSIGCLFRNGLWMNHYFLIEHRRGSPPLRRRPNKSARLTITVPSTRSSAADWNIWLGYHVLALLKRLLDGTSFFISSSIFPFK